MPKITPLSKREDFERLFKDGRGRKGRFFLLKFATNGEGLTRLSIIVSKKISKLAVTRNRCKRKAREAVRLASMRPKYDYILVCLQDISNISQKEIEEDVKKIFG